MRASSRYAVAEAGAQVAVSSAMLVRSAVAAAALALLAGCPQTAGSDGAWSIRDPGGALALGLSYRVQLNDLCNTRTDICVEGDIDIIEIASLDPAVLDVNSDGSLVLGEEGTATIAVEIERTTSGRRFTKERAFDVVRLAAMEPVGHCRIHAGADFAVAPGTTGVQVPLDHIGPDGEETAPGGYGPGFFTSDPAGQVTVVTPPSDPERFEVTPATEALASVTVSSPFGDDAWVFSTHAPETWTMSASVDVNSIEVGRRALAIITAIAADGSIVLTDGECQELPALFDVMTPSICSVERHSDIPDRLYVRGLAAGDCAITLSTMDTPPAAGAATVTIPIAMP